MQLKLITTNAFNSKHDQEVVIAIVKPDICLKGYVAKSSVIVQQKCAPAFDTNCSTQQDTVTPGDTFRIGIPPYTIAISVCTTFVKQKCHTRCNCRKGCKEKGHLLAVDPCLQ